LVGKTGKGVKEMSEIDGPLNFTATLYRCKNNETINNDRNKNKVTKPNNSAADKRQCC
jgi:hypothetical protein